MEPIKIKSKHQRLLAILTMGIMVLMEMNMAMGMDMEASQEHMKHMGNGNNIVHAFHGR